MSFLRALVRWLRELPQGALKCNYPGCKERYGTYLQLFEHQHREHIAK